MPHPTSLISRKGTRLPALALLLVLAVPVRADVSRADVQIAARALSFVSNPPTGAQQVGILYSAASTRSAKQAETLRMLLSGDFRVGALVLSPVLVELGDAASADVDFFFLTEHVSSSLVAGLARKGGDTALCITTDIEQVRRGVCTIGIQSRPKVEVFVSSAAAAANGITFSTVFRVMITEL